MGKVEDRIMKWGETAGMGDASLKAILRNLFNKEKLNAVEIAKKFRCSPPTIRYWLKKYGFIETRPTFEEYLTENGFASAGEFFRHPKNRSKKFRELSHETGYCYLTLSKAYKKFLKEEGFSKKGLS